MASVQSLLFVCNLNRVRSPMAAALARAMIGALGRVESCGLAAGDEVDPFAVGVMGELGLDLGGHRPRTLDDVAGEGFDLVVALTPEAEAAVRPAGALRGFAVEYWPTSDPTLAEGAREQRLEAYRQVRDLLLRRISARFGGEPAPSPGSGE